jgi:hypothetical protein
MNGRKGLVALLGAGLLVMAAVGSAAATAPQYAITVTKTADPPAVSVDGADVTFTVTVEAKTGDFHTVNVSDSLGGCTLSGPTGDVGSDGVLSEGETWTYTCTVADVTPETSNTATVDACHNSSPNCNQQTHDVGGSDQVTVGLCESDCPTNSPSESASASASTSVSPSTSGGGVGQTNVPPTDVLGPTGTSGPADSAWLLVVALGVLLASLVVLRPNTARRHR